MSKKHINDNDNDSSNEENESIENIDDVLDKDDLNEKMHRYLYVYPRIYRRALSSNL